MPVFFWVYGTDGLTAHRVVPVAVEDARRWVWVQICDRAVRSEVALWTTPTDGEPRHYCAACSFGIQCGR